MRFSDKWFINENVLTLSFTARETSICTNQHEVSSPQPLVTSISRKCHRTNIDPNCKRKTNKKPCDSPEPGFFTLYEEDFDSTASFL